MNSLQKQGTPSSPETREDFLKKFEAELLASDLETAEILMRKLKYLGLNFDPFGSEISFECQQVMDSLEIEEHLKNPYEATNILLRLLDKTEERINQLKQ